MVFGEIVCNETKEAQKPPIYAYSASGETFKLVVSMKVVALILGLLENIS